MSLDTLPVHRGLRVPRVARWSAEQDIPPDVLVRGGRLTYADPVRPIRLRTEAAQAGLVGAEGGR
ncbi:hypothetical protein [Streptomyces sp. NPDC056049]|uniref:hypothetical protein n=1 Tax=Streptomyces sp. NPDC056049 TaxID=3345693 RepID=UPI0035DCDBA6